MSKLVNLTPHPVVLYRSDNTPILTIPPSGIIARVRSERQVVGSVLLEDGSIPITTQMLGDLEDLPACVDGTLYITSFIAAQAAAKLGRSDVLVTDEAVRDENGKNIGCRALSRI